MQVKKTPQEEFVEAMWDILKIFRDWMIYAFMLWIVVPHLLRLLSIPIDPGFFDCLALVIAIRTVSLIITR